MAGFLSVRMTVWQLYGYQDNATPLQQRKLPLLAIPYDFMEVRDMSDDDRYSRQSFLGEHAETWIGTCVVGIIGLGGGGLHNVHQLAQIGFLRCTLYDCAIGQDVNLHR